MRGYLFFFLPPFLFFGAAFLFFAFFLAAIMFTSFVKIFLADRSRYTRVSPKFFPSECVATRSYHLVYTFFSVSTIVYQQEQNFFARIFFYYKRFFRNFFRRIFFVNELLVVSSHEISSRIFFRDHISWEGKNRCSRRVRSGTQEAEPGTTRLPRSALGGGDAPVHP